MECIKELIICRCGCIKEYIGDNDMSVWMYKGVNHMCGVDV